MKKITSVIIITAFLTTLTACGDTNNSSSTIILPTSTPSTPESSDSTPRSDNESAPQSSEENSPADRTPTAPQGEPKFLISCGNGGISATLENVERISDILIHDEDETETHQPAPVL